MTRPNRACSGGHLLSGSFLLDAQVKSFRPVTEAMLRNPAPGDWLNWRRTDNAWGYSPLDQITRQNVQQLQLAWSWSMDDTGSQQATPLVYDGVMYLPNPRGVIQALDAATGDLIWEYRPGATPAPPCGGATERRRADRHSAPLAASRHRRRRYRPRHPAQHRDLRRQDLRHHQRRAHRRARCAHGQAGVGRHGRRREAWLRVHLRPDRRSRKGDRRHDRVHPLQGRRVLHQRPRCRRPARSCGARRRSLVPASPAATRGASCR